MEGTLDMLHRNKTTLATDQAMRRGSRAPGISTKPAGNMFEDFGTTLSSQNQQKDPLSSQESSRTNQGTKTRKVGSARESPVTLYDSDDNDELDILSQHSDEESSTSRGGRTVKGKGKTKEGETLVDVGGGQMLPCPKEYVPKKLPSFKKKSAGADNNSTVPKSSTASSSSGKVSTMGSSQTGSERGGLHKPFKPPSIVDSNGTPSPLSSAKSTSSSITRGKQLGMTRGHNLPTVKKDVRSTTVPLQQRSPNGRKLPIRSTSPAISVRSTEEEGDKSLEHTPRPKVTGRPRPRPAYKGTGAGVTKPSASSKVFQVPSPLSSSQESSKQDTRGSEASHMSGIQDSWSPKSSPKGKGKAPMRDLQPFPDIPSIPEANSASLPSPKSSPILARSVKPFTVHPKAVPPQPPLNKIKGMKKQTKPKAVKVRKVVMSSSEGNSSDDGRKRPAKPLRELAAFPMQSQVSRKDGSSPGKRASEGSDLDDDGPSRNKKRRRNTDDFIRSVLNSVEFEEEDSGFIDPNVDPSTLCPWCDGPLPTNPSPLLQTLISESRSKSRPDPRPTNPLGLTAAVQNFVLICQRHEFESIQIPLAEQKGWPTHIDWESVGERVEEMRWRFQRIVDDVDEEFTFGISSRAGRIEDGDEDSEDQGENELYQRQRPRKGSTFWKDIVENIKSRGLRQTAGVHGQLSTFKKAQPGYYGELGYVIIHQTIYNHFPPESFPSSSTLPLTPTEFIQLVLVPEAAVALIMEDLHQTRSDAIQTLRESAEYGVAMFPDDSEHTPGANQAGEEIVKRRARERRKVLESEGEDGHGPETHDEIDLCQSEKEEVRTEPEVMDSDDEYWSHVGPPPSSSLDLEGFFHDETAVMEQDKEKEDIMELSDSGVSTRSTRSMTRKKAQATSSTRASRSPSLGAAVRNTKVSRDEEVIILSDSADSLPSKSQTTSSRKRPSKPKSKSRKPTTMDRRDTTDHIDLCESTDNASHAGEDAASDSDSQPLTWTKTPTSMVTPKPRRKKSRSISISPTGGKGKGKRKEKENSMDDVMVNSHMMLTGPESDRDIDLKSSPSRSHKSASIEVRFGRNGNHRVVDRRVGLGYESSQGQGDGQYQRQNRGASVHDWDWDVDSTPKAAGKVTVRSMSGRVATLPGDSGTKAGKSGTRKSSRTRRIEQPREGWVNNMAEVMISSDDDDEQL